jgi:putative ATP-dependent endonuclease of OLD family
LLRLRSCQIDNFRALRCAVLELDQTTVLIGENGCGKSSLLHALELCLGPQAPVGAFSFEPGDFYREHPLGPAGAIQIRLWFAEDSPVQDASLWGHLRDRGLVDSAQRLDFCLTVRATLDQDEVSVGYDFNQGARSEDYEALLAELRRLVPFIRIRSQVSTTERSLELENGLPADVLSRRLVHRQIRKTLADLVDVEAVSESVVTEAREAVREIMDHWAQGAGPEPSFDHESRVLAPLSASGTWAQMANLLRGSGARSLAMLAFAGAYLQARGGAMLDSDVRPLITVEDPETKLHPLMLTSVWNLIQRLAAQKIVTTNSADLLAAIPLGNLRRLTRAASGRVVVHRVPDRGMSLEELRRIAYHLRVRRGSALFMRFWLLVEGETEFWLLPEIARALKLDLRQEGVECLEFAQSGLTPLVRLASHLGIGWHLLSDGDRAGYSYFQQASLLADSVTGRVTVLRAHDIEQCLWDYGYSQIFYQAAGLRKSRHTKPRVIIEQALKNYSKPELAILLGEAMRASGSPGIPEPLEDIVRGAVHWAAHGTFD